MRFGNLGYQLLAVVIAIFLWVVARGSSSVERGFDIPVVLQGVPDDLVVVDQGADVVNVRVLGTRAALRNFDPQRLEYALDVSTSKPRSRASDSVSPTPASSGSVKIADGIAE